MPQTRDAADTQLRSRRESSFLANADFMSLPHSDDGPLATVGDCDNGPSYRPGVGVDGSGNYCWPRLVEYQSARHCGGETR